MPTDRPVATTLSEGAGSLPRDILVDADQVEPAADDQSCGHLAGEYHATRGRRAAE